MDAARMIADDFWKVLCTSARTITWSLVYSVCFLEQLGEDWIFVLYIQTFLSQLCDTNSPASSLTIILGAPIRALFVIFLRTISNSMKQFKRILCSAHQLKAAAEKCHPCRCQRVFCPHYSQHHSFAQPVQNCQNVLSLIWAHLNRLWSNWLYSVCPTWGHIDCVQWREVSQSRRHPHGW